MDYIFWLTALFTVAVLWVLMTANSIDFGKSDSFGNKTRLGKWLKRNMRLDYVRAGCWMMFIPGFFRVIASVARYVNPDLNSVSDAMKEARMILQTLLMIGGLFTLVVAFMSGGIAEARRGS
ncbi:hypothetical protein BBB56_22570 [Candidatus Pantoea deserta]|uniref:Uncharacterized protein n=1 Tax=Candidatus Pantoea deserta TaxID=1869313 RepID=A0A3N4NNT6_9GAMM|nr:hypothetical protein [Pantoea deserta]RPD93219.1 hypothetical protein BBB56_22570 [Pantoea deserta]